MRKIILLLLAVMTSYAFGQGVRFDGNNTTSAKNVPPGAQAAVFTLPFSNITVCGYPATPVDGSVCTNTVTISSDKALTLPITQPMAADSQGRFGFWVPPGTYSYSITTAGGAYVGTFALSLTAGPQGVPGPAGVGCGAANCIIAAPSVTQTITQPANTSLNIATSGTGNLLSNGSALISTAAPADQAIIQPSVSGIVTDFAANSTNKELNPTLFPGADLGAQINAAFASCLNKACKVKIPAGSYSFATAISMSLPGQVIEGVGPESTNITYTGTSDAIVWRAPSTFRIINSGAIRNLTLHGTAVAHALIHVSGVTSPILENLVVTGATGALGIGILFDDVAVDIPSWVERINVQNVHVGYSGEGNRVGMDFRNTSGTGSFDYSVFNMWFNVEAGQTGILVENGVDLFQISMNAKFNIDDPTNTATSAITVAGLLHYSDGHLEGEGAGTGQPNIIHVTSTGDFSLSGTVHIFTGFTTQAIPLIDAGGTYNVGPAVDFGYPWGNGSNAFIPQLDTKWGSIVSDGTLTISKGASGIYRLVWPNNAGTAQEMQFDTHCEPFASLCTLTITHNTWVTPSGLPIFSNPRILIGGTGDQNIPHIVIDIANRAGVSQTMFLSHINPAGSPSILFPTDSVGPTVVPLIGLQVDNFGSRMVGSSNMIQTTATAPGSPCTITGSISTKFNGVTVTIPTC